MELGEWVESDLTTGKDWSASPQLLCSRPQSFAITRATFPYLWDESKSCEVAGQRHSRWHDPSLKQVIAEMIQPIQQQCQSRLAKVKVSVKYLIEDARN